MGIDLAPLSWPVFRLGEALETLARRSGFAVRLVESLAPPSSFALDGCEQLGSWIEAAAGCLGLEVEPLEMSYAEVERLNQDA